MRREARKNIGVRLAATGECSEEEGLRLSLLLWRGEPCDWAGGARLAGVAGLARERLGCGEDGGGLRDGGDSAGQAVIPGEEGRPGGLVAGGLPIGGRSYSMPRTLKTLVAGLMASLTALMFLTPSVLIQSSRALAPCLP